MINYGKCYKQLKKCTDGFYSPEKICSYGRPVNIVTGSRSLGKSTGVAILVLLDFILNTHKFMYIRRRQQDTYKTCKTFFENAISIINSKSDLHIYGFKFYNGFYYINLKPCDPADPDADPDWIQCGLATPLSGEENLKSSVFSDYYTIIYDEFISKDPNRYLGTKDNVDAEWNALVSLYQTVDRGVDAPYRNETSLFLLANKSTIYNPIFLTLGVCDYVNTNANFTAPKNSVWVWEDVKDVYNHQQINSFGYLMSTDRVRDYAYENKSDTNISFIKKPTAATVYCATVAFKGEMYGIRHDLNYNYYIGKPDNTHKVLALDLESHDRNTLHLIQKWCESPLMVQLAASFKRGSLFFANGKIQNTFLKLLQFMP